MGLAATLRSPYLGGMAFFSRLSPIRAVRDLRYFLAQRQPYELGFLMLAVLLTGGVLFAFMIDSRVEKEYRPEIIYVKQWTLDRTDTQIKADQVVDQRVKDAAAAVEAKRQADLRAQFKRLDDKLEKWGI